MSITDEYIAAYKIASIFGTRPSLDFQRQLLKKYTLKKDQPTEKSFAKIFQNTLDNDIETCYNEDTNERERQLLKTRKGD